MLRSRRHEVAGEGYRQYECLHFRSLFNGPPHQILNAWRDGKIQLAISQEILKEYWRVGEVIAEQVPSIDLKQILGLVTIEAELYQTQDLPKPV